MKDRGVIVGIDLGTTFSLVSVLQDGVPRVLPNALGETLTPSAVAVEEDGTVLVGAAARAMAALRPERTATSFKRDMGTDRRYPLGKKTFTPQELSALVLGSLRRDAETALGVTIEEAVVSVPAYFGDAQRQATRDAAAIAGLRVERIVNEPTAAALAYGLHERDRESRIAVLDLGGGTFDVTVLEIIEGVIEIQSSAGDTRLGGDDFDDTVATIVQGDLERQHGFEEFGPLDKARIRDACELARKRLSDAESTRVALIGLGPGRKDVEVELRRDHAEIAWKPLLDRMRSPIRRALADANLQHTQIDEVLLVGGATRMPCVAKLATELFGRLPLRKLPPDEAVAMGTAVQAALKAGDRAVDDLVVTDVAPFTLGISSAVKMGADMVTGLFAPIIERGTVIPCSRVKRFSTLDDNQSVIQVEVYQGEHPTCEQNTRLARYKMSVPRKDAGEESIDVRFTYDLNGILEVDTRVVSTGKTHSMVIEGSPGRLSREQVQRAREAMKALKFHPRESLPNKTALARADALYVDLTGMERDMLSELIAGLKLALERQDAQLIEEARRNLISVTEALRGRR